MFLAALLLLAPLPDPPRAFSFQEDFDRVFAQRRCRPVDGGRRALETGGRARLADCAAARVIEFLDERVVQNLRVTENFLAPQHGCAGHICPFEDLNPLVAFLWRRMSATSVRRSCRCSERSAGVRKRGSSSHSGFSKALQRQRHSLSDTVPTVR